MQISAKDLGWLKTEGFCERCFWVKRHDRRLPYQTPFAGIFSSIDAYTKSIVESYFDKNKRLPDWLGEIGKVQKLIRVKPAEFKVQEGEVTFTGIPDQLFQRQEDGYGIIDYKTAKYTGNQDSLMPVYEIQLNGYAYIAESLGMAPVKELFLVYFEPPYKERFEEFAVKHTTSEGFEMPFRPNVHKIKKNTNEIKKLLVKAEGIFDMEDPPEGLEGCEDCEKLRDMLAIIYGRKDKIHPI